MAKPKPIPTTTAEAKSQGLQTLLSTWKIPLKKKRGRRRKKGNLHSDKLLLKSVVPKKKAVKKSTKQIIKTKPRKPPQPHTNWARPENQAKLAAAVDGWWLQKKD